MWLTTYLRSVSPGRSAVRNRFEPARSGRNPESASRKFCRPVFAPAFENLSAEPPAHDNHQRDHNHEQSRRVAYADVKRRADRTRQWRVERVFFAEPQRIHDAA